MKTATTTKMKGTNQGESWTENHLHSRRIVDVPAIYTRLPWWCH